MPDPQAHSSDIDGSNGLYGVFEQTPDVIFFTKNADRRFERANYAFARLCGAQYPQDLRGRTSWEFFTADLAEIYDSWDVGVLNSGLTLLNRFYRANDARGEDRWLFGARMFMRDPRTADPIIVGYARLMPNFRSSNSIYARLQTATNLIADSIADAPNASELADLSGCSVSQLNRDFIRFLGVTPHVYMTDLRMQRAKDLISAGMRLADVALECGFSDQSSFARCFKNRAGATPGEFARLRRKGVVASSH